MGSYGIPAPRARPLPVPGIRLDLGRPEGGVVIAGSSPNPNGTAPVSAAVELDPRRALLPDRPLPDPAPAPGRGGGMGRAVQNCPWLGMGVLAP